ncbi:MAG: hypothetical protein JSS81_26190 [Acidobacteria bacterium]|nr:hypothetical protein [Acidobacteriota bacterium]
MLDEERRELDMYKRALACVAADFADLPRESAGARAGEMLRADVALIDEQSGLQSGYDGAAREGTARRRVARAALRECLKRFAETARTIARQRPGFAERYPSSSGSNDERLLADARSVAAALDADRAEFTALGVADEYIDATNAKVEAFGAAVAQTGASRGGRGAAVSARTNAFETAENHFATLDTYIKNRYFNDPARLAAWRIASHVERAPRRKRTTARKK